MIKLQIGGSPCTYWSIAQTSNRETEPSGMGWELFENYLIALEKFKPDYFLYENNKSMSAAIRAEITKRFGFEPVCINSALVSAQNRQRLYWCGKRNPDGTYSRVDVQQPEDKGVLLQDILETGVAFKEKGYTLKAQYYKSSTANAFAGHFPAPMAAEPVNITSDGKSQCLRATYYKDGIRNMVGNSVDRKTCVAEPVRVCNIDGGSQGNRIYSAEGKSCAVKANGGGLGGHGQGLYAVPADCDVVVTENSIRCQRRDAKHSTVQGTHVNFEEGKPQTVSTSHVPNVIRDINKEPIKPRSVYEVKNGIITINGNQYPIKLADGFYIIRKLTVTECKRLQTVPDGYAFPVSDTQAYKMLGNGWTVDVITHILSHCQGISDEPLDVLSMYDGMACGHIALDKLEAHIQRYRATEIDKYAIKTACYNFPDIEQIGDAFQVREWN